MLIWDITKFVRRTGGKVYLKPAAGLTDGHLIDYSEKEDLIRIEWKDGNKGWYAISNFFHGYPVRKGRLIGLMVGSRIIVYEVGDIVPKKLGNRNYVYAELIGPLGSRRVSWPDDRPFERLNHGLESIKQINTDLPF